MSANRSRIGEHFLLGSQDLSVGAVKSSNDSRTPSFRSMAILSQRHTLWSTTPACLLRPQGFFFLSSLCKSTNSSQLLMEHWSIFVKPYFWRLLDEQESWKPTLLQGFASLMLFFRGFFLGRVFCVFLGFLVSEENLVKKSI